MNELPLGKKTEYKDKYDPGLLVAVPRKFAREQIGIKTPLPFKGVDMWNCYEISWLDSLGKPCVRIARLYVSCYTECLIESKSLKLYFNSFNNTNFKDESEVLNVIENDLNTLLDSKVKVEMYKLNDIANEKLSLFQGDNIDDLAIKIKEYSVNPNLLRIKTNAKVVDEVLTSNLLKSNCLITNQPDWASVQIKYTGFQIDRESLLRYIISFRNHNEFHEQCVEQIFNDIMNACSPYKLTVYAKYTRRGGLDINPFRTSVDFDEDSFFDYSRDIRQ